MRRVPRGGSSTHDEEWNVTSPATTSELVYDPVDHDTIFNPHALFRRLRDEATSRFLSSCPERPRERSWLER
jgi:hypothetical protein